MSCRASSTAGTRATPGSWPTSPPTAAPSGASLRRWRELYPSASEVSGARPQLVRGRGSVLHRRGGVDGARCAQLRGCWGSACALTAGVRRSPRTALCSAAWSYRERVKQMRLEKRASSWMNLGIVSLPSTLGPEILGQTSIRLNTHAQFQGCLGFCQNVKATVFLCKAAGFSSDFCHILLQFLSRKILA